MESDAREGGAVGYLKNGLRPSQLVDQPLTVAGLMELVEGADERPWAAPPRRSGI